MMKIPVFIHSHTAVPLEGLPIKPTGKFRQVPVPKDYPTKDIAKWYGSRLKTGKGFEGAAPYTKTELMKNPKLLWEGIKENPYWSGAAGVYGGPAAGALGVGIAKGPVWSGIKQAADLAVPDWLYDQDKHLAEIAARKKAEEKEEPVVTPYLESKGTKTELTAAQKEKWADAQRGKRLDSLLDIMGYDQSRYD